MISIIIIVKNDRGIENTLDSLNKIPKPEKTEIIVVDASEENLDDIKKKFPKVRWIYFHNKTNKKITIPEQRNLGIKKAKGDIIVFIDANCIPNNNWLIQLIKPINKEQENIVAGLTKSQKEKSIWDQGQDRVRNERYLPECPTINLAFKKKLIRKIDFFDERFNYGSDVEFSWRAINAGYKIRYAQKAIIYHDWGDVKQEIKRAIRYGEARVKLYGKYPERLKYIMTNNQGLFNIYAPIFTIYILLIPIITFIWPYYLLGLMIPIIKNVKINLVRKLLFDFFYGFGVLKELFFS